MGIHTGYSHDNSHDWARAMARQIQAQWQGAWAWAVAADPSAMVRSSGPSNNDR